MKIAVLPGDGIGPETVAQAVKVLQALAKRGLTFEMEHGLVGGAAYEAAGDPLPPASFSLAQKADAILFGAVGRDEFEHLGDKRPGVGLMRLRKELNLFANFRPVKMFPELIGASTLRAEVVDGLDLAIVRELTGDVYFGQPRGISRDSSGQRIGINTMRYTEEEIRRIAHVGFRTAMQRRRRLCSVDKANALESMMLWRDVVSEVAREYPEVELSHMYVDAAAMMLVRAPKQFDVLVTANLFGDILSDVAAMLTGSIGMLPSASLGSSSQGLYEPIHGSAPDIAGKDIANPIAAILSAAMMLRHSFALEDAAVMIERAVQAALAKGYRTADIKQPGTRLMGTEAMGNAIAAMI